MKKYLQGILLVLSLLFTQSFLAQKLYWVVGSGNFNDPAHWSLQSGGVGGVKTPTASDDVYFDEKSFKGHSIVNIIGDANCHDLIFFDNIFPVILSGTQNEKVVVGGDIKLNTHITNQFLGSIHLVSSKASTMAHFGSFFLKGNLYFDGTGSYNLETILGSDNAEVYINNGRVKLVNSTISSGSIFIGDNATLEVTESILKVKNKLWFNNQSTLINNGIYIEAPVDDPTRYNAGNNQISDSRIANNNSVLSSCAFTATVVTQPTCANFCDGVVEFTIPASCSGSAPYKATWSNGSGCANPIGTPLTGLTAGTYTQSNVCGCGSAYTIVLYSGAPGYGSFAGSINFNVNAPSAVQAFTSSVEPLCNSACNGKIYATIIGGTQPYSNQWIPGPTHAGNTGSDSIINLCVPPSSYTLAVTDAHNCKDSVTIAMVQPTTVVANGNSTPPTCFGFCNGLAWVTPSNGTPFGTVQSNGIFYTTVWDGNPAKNNDTLPNLCGNSTHTCVVTDGNACTATYIVTIGAGPLQITYAKSPLSGIDSINCLNTCNGTVGATGVSGGTGAYTFSWTPSGGTVVPTGTNSSTYSNLCGTVAGNTYTCTIKDANSCTVTATYTVIAPPVITLTTFTAAPKCNTGSTGSATVIASGGTSAYTFAWNPTGTVSGVSPKSINSNIPGGTYSVITTDAKGCKDSTTVVLTPPPAITGTMTTIVNPTCPNLNNGQMCVTAGGGTPVYTYSWSPNPPAAGTASCTPSTLTVTAGGSSTYSVTITDANSCSVTVVGTVNSPSAVAVTAVTTDPPCSGTCNGSTTLTPTSGLAPFTYSWSCSAVTTNTLGGLCGGISCNYTVTDANTCKTTGSISTNTTTPVTLSLTPTSLLCAGDCNAQITSLAGGGTGPYTYTWTGTGTNPVIAHAVNQTGMCAGSYTCNITDSHGCTQTATTSISAPTPISITLTPTEPTCSGSTNGSILGTIGGGTGALTHTWTPPVIPPGTLNPNNLSGGITYSLEVVDSKGCVDSDTLTLINPTPVVFSLTTTSITCSGGTGTASVTSVSGGTPGYQYNWNVAGFAAAPTFSNNLSAGTYTIAVEDSKGCLATTQFFNIASPPTLIASVINIVKTCNGLCNGGGTASVSGGTAPYKFSWDVAGPYSASDSIISTLCVGTHTLFVQDANGCTTSTTFSVSPLVNIAISVSSNTVSCNNVCDATGTASASGGASPYNIAWVNTTTCTAVAASCTAFSLCPGTQTVIATDIHGCSSTSTISIVNPPILSASVTATSVNCFGLCTGAATVTPSGGTPAGSAPLYNINWSAPLSSTITTVSNLCPGTYTANIVDHNGCALTQTVNIAVSGQFSVTPSKITPSTCGASDGSIGLAISGGSGTYTVSWSPGAIITQTLTNIPAGSYTATINDGNGCDTAIVYGLNSPTGPVMNYTVTNASCYSTCNGSAMVVATGTNNPIQVTWQTTPFTTGVGSITVPNLCGDSSTNYLVKAIDDIGCITFTTVTVTSPTKIRDNPTTNNPTCGASNGSISLAPNGGSGTPYSFVWNGGSTSNPYTGLPAGIDTVTIKDGAGCTQQETYTLITTGSPSVTVGTSSVTCSYLTNGVATATVSGGTPAYSYTWTGTSGVIPPSGVNISNIANLAVGSYTLNVRDANSCTTNTVFTIAGPTAINAGFTSQNVLCNGGATGSASVSPSGGTPGYTYDWNPPAFSPTVTVVNSLTQGNNYFVIITDANFCTDTVKFSISQPTTLTMTVASTPPTCFGGTNGTATVTVSGGTPSILGTSYTYTWSPNVDNNPTAINLSVGNSPYQITASDSNGCTISTILVYTVQPTQVQPIITKTNITCGASCNGSITSTPTGGTGGVYTYTWSPTGFATTTSTTSSTYSNLCANTYTLVVADSLNCRDTSTITLNTPTKPQLTYTASAATCGAASCNGSITITSTVGNGSVTVSWLNSASSCGSSLTCSPLCAGTYSVQLTDSTNCVDTALVTLSDSNGPAVTMSFTNVTCNGSSDGAASVTNVNLNANYTFSWIPVPPGTITSTSNFSLDSAISAGTGYISTVTDSAGCKTITTFTITQPSPINDAPIVTNATCSGINNGTIISSGSGGTPYAAGYLYSIDNGVFTALPTASFTFTALSAGSHTVCIEDSLHCISCFIYTVPPNSVIISQIAATNVTCFGICNGTATVSNINNGTAPYAISWNDPSSQSGTFATNLCSGSYTAIVTDAMGCMSKDTITVTAPDSINPHSSVTAPSCGICNGVITLNPTGGTGTTYTYTWSNPGNTNSISNVCAGVSSVEITDSLGCQQNFLIVVSSSSSLSVTVASTSVTCGNLCNGSATVTAIGGTSPYTYLWPNTLPSSTFSVVSSLCANTTYFVEVQDVAGCIGTQSVSITGPVDFTVTSSTTSPGCTLSTGIITTTVVGSSTYSYQWSANAGSVTTSSVTNLPAGIYTLVVTDITSGCTKTVIIPLNNNAGPSLTTAATAATCFGICNATATVTVTGGTLPNAIVWNTSPSQTFSVATTLCGDSTYAVTVTDGAGCVQIKQITINQPSQLHSSISVVSPITCHNDSNGIINANIFGGTPSYSYTWTPSSVTGSGGTNLGAGTYSATVADANGCTVQVFDTLTNPSALIITGTVTPTSCNNTSDGAINTTTSGGTPAYTYTWSGASSATTPSLSAVSSGNYTVVVTDSKLCTDTANFAIIPTVAIVVNAGRDTALCTTAPIILTGTVTGTTTFDWQDISGTIIPPINTLTLSVNPAITTEYVLSAYNSACRDSDTVVVTVNPAIIANAGASQAIFIGQSVNIGANPSNPSGGTITWMPNTGLSDTATSNPLSTPLVTTTYTLLVTNAFGCTATDTMIVTVLPPIVINSGFTPNGDGKNDTWVLDDFYKFPNGEVEIYNRWGEQLFYSKGSYTPWNGTYNGQPLPVGTYYYIIRLNDKNFPDHYAGPLTILR